MVATQAPTDAQSSHTPSQTRQIQCVLSMFLDIAHNWSVKAFRGVSKVHLL